MSRFKDDAKSATSAASAVVKSGSAAPIRTVPTTERCLAREAGRVKLAIRFDLYMPRCYEEFRRRVQRSPAHSFQNELPYRSGAMSGSATARSYRRLFREKATITQKYDERTPGMATVGW
jgi:hypothetical protein